MDTSNKCIRTKYWTVANYANQIIGADDKTYSILQGMAMQYEPTLVVDTGTNFTPRQGDTTGAVFGFRYRNIGTNTTGENFNRFVLNKTGITGSVKVLGDPWLQNQLCNIIYTDGNPPGQYRMDNRPESNGEQWR